MKDRQGSRKTLKIFSKWIKHHLRHFIIIFDGTISYVASKFSFESSAQTIQCLSIFNRFRKKRGSADRNYHRIPIVTQMRQYQIVKQHKINLIG